MNNETVEHKVRKTIAEHFGLKVEEVDSNDELTKFNIDSLDIVELVMELEDTFKIAIEETAGLNTVNKIVTLVESKLAG